MAMQFRKKARGLATFVALNALIGLGSPKAEAQTGYVQGGGGYAPGWNGYVSGNGWTRYSPNVVAPPAPAQTAQATAPAAAWRGYNPGEAWRSYRPGTALQGRPTASAPTSSRTTRSASTFKPSHYREYGTGRNMFMHKPWLPNHP
ncbi:hypothetical protein V5E97_05405 [Singulisphaera sp. Ch08]|uniref:BcpO-related WXXGXW repeat protein n=1 Tax=Singulisphaera sp. Ch08 TaxID=3120278 RepID=A0AAU7CJW7_9BACT